MGINMLDQAKVKIGDKVCYLADTTYPENGMIKEVPKNNPEYVWVVYSCAGKWKNFKDYTAENTRLCDLTMGWRH